jgi:HAD superfamily hydrolase (TIGR01490 family)
VSASEASEGITVGQPVEAPARSRAAAFFDLDRTMMAGSSGIYFARAAHEAGLMTRRQLARDALRNIRFRLRGSTDEAANAVRERVGKMITDVPVRDLQRLVPRVLAGVLPRLYPEMLKLAYEHQDAGRRVYIATAASHEMATMLAHVLGFDGGIGTRSQIVNDVYTGRAAGPYTYRDGKVEEMRELAAREGISLADSYAYSDSESDLPMLRAVGHAVVVNPDAELTQIARAEGWEIMRLDRLGRRLRLAAATAGLAASAAAGAVAARRARERSARPRRRLELPRR